MSGTISLAFKNIVLILSLNSANSMLLQTTESWFFAEQDSPTRFQVFIGREETLVGPSSCLPAY